MNYNFRVAKKNDIAELDKLQSQNFSVHTRENFEFVINNDNYLFLIAHSLENDKKIIAYAGVSISYERSDLLTVCVDEEYRKRGIAKLLLNELFERVALRGVNEVLLEVNENNLPAINLYLSMGFEQIHKRRNYYGNETAVIMRKIL